MGLVDLLVKNLGVDKGQAEGGAGTIFKLAQLAGAFEKLGLDPAMVTKFLPIILSFVQKKGGSGLADLLQGALGTDTK